MRAKRIRQMGGAALLGASAVLLLASGADGFGARGVLAAQQMPPQMPPQAPGTPTAAPVQPDAVPESVRAHMDEERTRMLNDDRHQRLAEDADKLIALSNELKADVDKTGKDELSVEVMRKAAEIEKLAHDVQNRMKN